MSKRQAKRQEKNEVDQGQIMLAEILTDVIADTATCEKWIAIIKREINDSEYKTKTKSKTETNPR